MVNKIVIFNSSPLIVLSKLNYFSILERSLRKSCFSSFAVEASPLMMLRPSFFFMNLSLLKTSSTDLCKLNAAADGFLNYGSSGSPRIDRTLKSAAEI